jgi:hypothetical protein
MSLYKKNPVTSEELHKWRKIKTINPRTGRKIKLTSPIYKYLKEENEKMHKEDVIFDDSKILHLIKNIQGPMGTNYLKSKDNKDMISQEDIWVLLDGEKKPSDDIPKYKLFSYTDSNKMVRCFNIESIKGFIDNNHKIVHPITKEDIDDKDINRAKEMIKILQDSNILEKKVDDNVLTEQKIKNMAFNIFQKFSLMSIFIDSEWFLSLNTDNLLKLNYELKDFYDNNVDDESKKIMVPNDGNAFQYSKEELNSKTNKSHLEIQNYLLINIDKVISASEDEAMKNLGNYLMIGGLAVVCPEIRKCYPDFVYSFSF